MRDLLEYKHSRAKSRKEIETNSFSRYPRGGDRRTRGEGDFVLAAMYSFHPKETRVCRSFSKNRQFQGNAHLEEAD